MVALAADVDAIENLVPLVPAVPVERRNDIVEKGELLDRLDHVLAGGRVEVVVGALEDEAQALGHEADLIRLAPAEQVEGELAHAVVLRHAVHARLPAELGGFQRVVALEVLEGLGLVLGILLALLVLALPAQALALDVGEADGVVLVEVGGEIPLAVVRIVAANVVGV